jgi:N-acetylglutamate synthase-like GNAT family acetyltransferase
MLEILIQQNKILDVINLKRQTSDRELTVMAIREEEMQTLSGARWGLPEIVIRPLEKGEDATAFRTLNEEWITRYFTLEEKDQETLGNPEKMILEKGGYIFMVYSDNLAVGCVALIPIGNGVYELSKMAVSPGLRGLGIGRRLLQHAITEAKRIGAKSLFLGSNAKLKNAVHLYESVGFRHVAPENIPPMPYTRANVFMEMPL